MSNTALIQQRLEFLDIDEDVIEGLQEARQILGPELDRMLDKFYARISAEPQLKSLFEDDVSVAYARQAQKNHWLESLMVGDFTSEHFDRAEAIGRAHARAGLTPNWYIGGYSNMLTQFIKPVLDAASANGRDASTVIEALCKAVMLDLDLVIHCYLEAKDRVILDQLLAATRFIDELDETNSELRSTLVQIRKSLDGLASNAAEDDPQAEALTGLARHAEALAKKIRQLDERIDELKSGKRLYLQRGTEHTGTFSRLAAGIIED